ncbi:hypothetical protein BD626DRAFT_574265 [Schizophyllum amplum]|uniref:DUF6699 domain-containing protein n=1 Tax=Schizophyllum amplum TaxID=97359 RepID=A0A550BYJ9_9AGAR|nr:hypothetical protein BD626DRAFT_574265 [Auriculariopsis ampla]
MASVFRALFGSRPSTPTAEKQRRPRSSSRPRPSSSSPASQPSEKFVYIAPSTPPTERKRASSHVSRSAAPSPLRYDTYDAATNRARGRTKSTSQTGPVHVPLYRTSSHKAKERPSPYPLFQPSTSYCSSRSASSSVSGRRPSSAPRSSSSCSVSRNGDPRPVLKHTRTSSDASRNGPHAHVSFQNPNRTETLHMHPLLAHGRLCAAPISYDVTLPPSSRTVLDRGTRTPVPAHTLLQPASEAPSHTSLVLASDKFPWPVVAASGARAAARFYLSGSAPHRASPGGEPVTVLDVLYALHNTLMVRVTQEEWDALGAGSRAQRKVTRAYEARCARMGGGWEGGVRRIDWLGEKTRLVGVEVDKSAGGAGIGKLVFSKV